MGLRYSFRHLFFGGNINKKRLYQILEDLDSAAGGDAADITELESDVEALQTTVGDAEGGLVKDVSALETLIGDPDAETPAEGSILARIKALEDAT